MRRLFWTGLTVSCGITGWWLGLPSWSPPPLGKGVENTVEVAKEKPAGGLKLETVEGGHDPISLLAVSPADFPVQLRKAIQQGWREEKLWFARRWAALDPPAVYAFLRNPGGGVSMADEDILQICFASWFRRDMPAALAVLEALADTDSASGSSGLSALLEVDPKEAAKFLSRHPDTHFSVYFSNKNFRAFARAVPGLPAGDSIKEQLESILRLFCQGPDIGKGRAEALAWLAELTPEVRLGVVPVFTSNIEKQRVEEVREIQGKAFPEEDIALLEKTIRRGTHQENGPRIALLKALRNPDAALKWAGENLTGQTWFEAMHSLLLFIVPQEFEAASAYLKKFPKGRLHDLAFWEVTRQLQEANGPKATYEWVLTLPDSADVSAGIELVVVPWAQLKWPECAAWLTDLLESPRRVKAAALALSALMPPAEESLFGRNWPSANDVWKEQLKRASQLPGDLALRALEESWRGGYAGDCRPRAQAAAQLPEGPIRELAMKTVSRNSWRFFEGYNQLWLNWAVALPTAADRAAALRGAEDGSARVSRWKSGIRAMAEKRLSAGEIGKINNR